MLAVCARNRDEHVAVMPAMHHLCTSQTTHLSVTDVFIHRVKPIESIVHVYEVSLQQHFHLLNCCIVLLVPSVRLALQAESTKCQPQGRSLLKV